MEKLKIALDLLSEAARVNPQNAMILWQAAQLLINDSNKKNESNEQSGPGFKPLWAEFDYVDESGLYTHRTIQVIALTDGRDVKRNEKLPLADRYGYLLTGYCTMRNKVRAFRSSRISNLHTFTDGIPGQPNYSLPAQLTLPLAS